MAKAHRAAKRTLAKKVVDLMIAWLHLQKRQAVPEMQNNNNESDG